LSGRLDQTVHTLSFLHKLRSIGRRIFVVTDENVGWVLDEAWFFFLSLPFPLLSPRANFHFFFSNSFFWAQGKHRISIDHSILGPTCGLLPVGVDSTLLTTTGLRWNLSTCMSSLYMGNREYRIPMLLSQLVNPRDSMDWYRHRITLFRRKIRCLSRLRGQYGGLPS